MNQPIFIEDHSEDINIELDSFCDSEPSTETIKKIESEQFIPSYGYSSSSINVYCKEARLHSLLTDDEVIELSIKKDNGDISALNKLIESNLLLVVSIANKVSTKSMDIDDLVQEGNIGLMRAAQKYDYTKGFKFSTYATYWIRQTIFRSIANKSRTIRYPVHLNNIIVKLKNIEKEYGIIHDRIPTMEEYIDLTGFSQSEIEKAQRAINLTCTSLSAPIGGPRENGEKIELVDLIPSESDIDNEYQKKALKDALVQSIRELMKNEQEVFIIIRSFGLDGDRSATLEELGKYYGVTRERIRQILNRALSRLHESSKFVKLYQDYYLDD